MPRWVSRTVVAALLVLSWPTGLLAQTADQAALAESLFRHGKKLMQDGAVAEACPKFAESYRLDPTLGTLLNLGVCHEQQGRTATAWAELEDAAARAARSGEKERAAFARQHAEALEARLSHLTIRVADPLPGLEVRLDDQVLGQAAWSTAMPVDPGPHRIQARAPGHDSWSRTVTVGPGPVSDEVLVPALAAVVDDVLAPAPVPPPRLIVEPGPQPEPPRRSSARVAGGWAAATVGLAGIGVGTYFGLRTFSKQKIVERECVGPVCSADGLAADHDAHQAARWSNVGFAAGLVGIGAAAALWLWPAAAPAHTAWRLAPLALDGPGLVAGRTW